jgi:hypothetical protein
MPSSEYSDIKPDLNNEQKRAIMAKNREMLK